MSTTPGREPNCFKMVSSLTDKNAATSETVSIRGRTFSAALIAPAVTDLLRLLEDISTGSPLTTNFSSCASVTRLGPLRSVTLTSAIGGLRRSLRYRGIRYPLNDVSRMGPRIATVQFKYPMAQPTLLLDIPIVAVVLPQIFPPSFRDMSGQRGLYFEAAAVITDLVLLGQVLELKARSQTSGAIKALLGLAPKTARRISDDSTEEDVDLKAIQVGDRLRVRPGEKFRRTAL
ncbi:Lead, cadmium, zinc and mercury transporting ATPase [Granulicella sibirica]|uniref:Lead, cadmium, zinc and mercury transporting ATPase n=1 Tax=Granulicella sibirica TaxID=2479048 RepID=A0A4Q0SXI9_9BACT|nr:Lead, cadmium, zinc and mercury transporting ATPase [Granulicella sibirica]